MPRHAAAALLLTVALAACGGDSNLDDRLTPQEVQGTYSVCTFRFHPENTAFPVADLLLTVMDSTPPAGRPTPTLALNAAREYDLVYTRQRDGFLQALRGSYALGASSVSARFYEDQAAGVAAEALLPSSMPMNFQDAPRRLTLTYGLYTVRRADYAAAAGIAETGLQERVSGQLQVALQVGGCP